jgi:hypothetical protein|tara:strand:- start:328 stop:546 length:219 start_codon:yes stop_codon:yes gene_type:complete
MTDITDINPIVNVGTDKNPMYVLDATWMTVLYEKITGKDFKGDDDYVKFTDRFVKEYNEGGFDTTLAIKRMM